LVERPQGFGSEYGVASAFDAIRYINDSISERLGRDELEPFVETPYATMVKRVRMLSTDVSLLEGQTEHYDASRVTKVEATITELRTMSERTIGSLKHRVLEPLAEVHHQLMDPRNTISDRVDEVEAKTFDV
jgi:hypothetical protein